MSDETDLDLWYVFSQIRGSEPPRDLLEYMQRIQSQGITPALSHIQPKLVSYLAAGGIEGLRPLRYEKRIARYRFIALIIAVFLVLLGIASYLIRNWS